MQIQPHTIKQLLTLVIACLIAANVLELLIYLVDVAAGVLGTIVIGVLALFANWRAGQAVESNLKYYMWRLVPVTLLAGVPVISFFLFEQTSVIDWLLIIRLLIGLILPILILLYVERWIEQRD